MICLLTPVGGVVIGSVLGACECTTTASMGMLQRRAAHPLALRRWRPCARRARVMPWKAARRRPWMRSSASCCRGPSPMSPRLTAAPPRSLRANHMEQSKRGPGVCLLSVRTPLWMRARVSGCACVCVGGTRRPTPWNAQPPASRRQHVRDQASHEPRGGAVARASRGPAQRRRSW